MVFSLDNTFFVSICIQTKKQGLFRRWQVQDKVTHLQDFTCKWCENWVKLDQGYEANNS